MSQSSVTCPSCGFVFNIDDVFYNQIKEKHRQEFQAERQKLMQEIEAKRQEYKSHFEQLRKKEMMIEERQRQFEESVRKAADAKLLEERARLAEEIRQKLEMEHAAAMSMMEKELADKSRKIQELNAARIEIERLKREKEEEVSKARLAAEETMTRKLEEERRRLQEGLAATYDIKLKEKEEQMAQLRRSLEEAKRKADQGSMQIQGEAMELSIEEWLRSQFPLDAIDEVKKGAFGADCIQTVHTREFLNCGKICYESKNAKNWNNEWLAKLKQDMIKVNADIGVLVTTVYPPGMQRMGLVDGIWVCSLTEFKGIAALLRQSLIRVHEAVKRDENRSDKMSLLYDYLTGKEFRMQMEAIVNGFVRMQEELDKERRSLMASWKRRQKIIDGVLSSTTELYGALQGIAGSGAIPQLETLELPETFEEED